MNCELCHRNVADYTIHHLIPGSRKRSHGGTAVLCKACHRMIHHLFTNRQLADEFNDIHNLGNHQEVEKFVSWVQNQDPHKRVKIA